MRSGDQPTTRDKDALAERLHSSALGKKVRAIIWGVTSRHLGHVAIPLHPNQFTIDRALVKLDVIATHERY